MVKVSAISIPPGMETIYNQVIQPGDRFIYSHVKVKRLFTSRSRKKGLTQKSLMVSLAPVWAGFDSDTKDAWNEAAVFSSMTGWKLFVQDTALRIANGLSGYSTPNNLYQSFVGKMQVEDPALGLTIVQLHPHNYYISKKVRGTKSQYSPVLVTEDLTLPIEIGISYKSDLISAGAEPRARFFINVYSSYQGRTLENLCIVDFDLSHDWERKTATISGVIGQFRGYTAFIEIHNAQGTLLFDNVDIIHGAHNWARDPFCNSIQTTFTKAFYQIPKNWAAEDIETGVFYKSVFHG